MEVDDFIEKFKRELKYIDFKAYIEEFRKNHVRWHHVILYRKIWRYHAGCELTRLENFVMLKKTLSSATIGVL